MNIGEIIKTYRLKKGWEQKYLAEQIGIKAPSITAMEKGRTNPSPENLRKLQEVLEIPDSVLFPNITPYTEAPAPREPELRYIGRAPILIGTVSATNEVRFADGKIWDEIITEPPPYSLKVESTSMVGYNIYPDDKVVIEPTKRAENGEFVIIKCYDNEALMLKRFRVDYNKVPYYEGWDENSERLRFLITEGKIIARVVDVQINPNRLIKRPNGITRVCPSCQEIVSAHNFCSKCGARLEA